MQAGYRMLRLATAVLGCAASLLFFPYETANAGQESRLTKPLGDTYAAPAGKVFFRNSTGVVTSNAALCVKCHSACEDGRSHVGLSALAKPGSAGLPLNAEGRTICITCHESRRHDVKGVSDGYLRISNLRRELCLTCHGQDAGDVPRIEIVSPLERALIQEKRVALIGRVSGLSESDLIVRLNGAEFHLQVKGGEFSTWLKLQDGVNRIEVALQEHLLWKGEVFHGESRLDDYKLTSSGHRTGNRAECRECHLKREELHSGIAGASPALCYGCHDRIDEKRYVHGPLAVGDCLACHDPHGGYGTAHLRQEEAVLCGNCHAASEHVATVACNTAGKGCVDCHDPHQSNMRYLLKGPQVTMR